MGPPIIISQGMNVLVELEKGRIRHRVDQILRNRYKKNKEIPKLWDGKSSQRILNVLFNKCCASSSYYLRT